VLENLDALFDLDLSHGIPLAAAPEIMPPDRCVCVREREGGTEGGREGGREGEL
jgi:hypothetical protein